MTQEHNSSCINEHAIEKKEAIRLKAREQRIIWTMNQPYKKT